MATRAGERVQVQAAARGDDGHQEAPAAVTDQNRLGDFFRKQVARCGDSPGRERLGMLRGLVLELLLVQKGLHAVAVQHGSLLSR